MKPAGCTFDGHFTDTSRKAATRGHSISDLRAVSPVQRLIRGAVESTYNDVIDIALALQNITTQTRHLQGRLESCHALHPCHHRPMTPGLSSSTDTSVSPDAHGRRALSTLLLRITPYILLLFITTCSLVTEQPGAAPALQFLYGPETSRKLVVFVHGVLGDSLTWTNPSGQSWPELMRDDDAFRDYRIATYRFDSPLLGPASTFQEVSTRMLQQLEDSGVFRKYREIYFITHSAGGVVTKRALVTVNNVDIDKLQLVKSVLYIATPAQGADIADLGAWFSLNPQFRDLQSTDFNSYLQNLEDEWADLMRRRPAAVPIAFCAYEKKPLRFRVIVDRKSAFTYCDRNATAFDENHISIVKPASRDSDVYQWARARIQEASELVRRAPSAVSDQKRLEYELKRNAFLLESGKPITTATLMIQLKRPYTPEELGHYRVLLEITDLHRPGDPKPPSFGSRGRTYLIGGDTA